MPVKNVLPGPAFRLTFLSLLLLSALMPGTAQSVSADFTVPDTVCVGENAVITNSSVNGATWLWNFCAAGANVRPETNNLGNFAGMLNEPAFMDVVQSGEEYFGFVTNYKSGNLVRLDFGSSLLNSPIAHNLGNFNSNLPSEAGSGGIRVVNNEGKWYAIIVAGYPPGGTNPRIMKVSFGSNIRNQTPVLTNWGQVGNMYDPKDLEIIRDGNEWYGFTVNAETNSISFFRFGNSFENPPTGNNLGNPGSLAYPTGIFMMQHAGIWKMFVTNAGDDTRTNGYYSICRLDFTQGIANAPETFDYGNIGNSLQHPRDLIFVNACDRITAFIVNGHPLYNNLDRIRFTPALQTIPAPNYVNNGEFDLPHCVTPLKKQGDVFVSFVVNKGNHTISRLTFGDCNNADISVSDLQQPPPVRYNAPGNYTISLTVNKGLSSESSVCRQIVVKDCESGLILTPDTILCAGDTFRIRTARASDYQWSPGAFLDDPSSPSPLLRAKENVTCYVSAIHPQTGERISDSIHIVVKKPFIKANHDTTVCALSPVQLFVEQGAFFSWSPQAGLNNAGIPNPVATPSTTTQYIVTGRDPAGCLAKDTVLIHVLPAPAVLCPDDTTVCAGAPVSLQVSGDAAGYRWSPAQYLNAANIARPTAIVENTTVFRLMATATNQCTSTDSVIVHVRPRPIFQATAAEHICAGVPLQLVASGGDNYSWTPSSIITDATAANTVAQPDRNTDFSVRISENICHYDTTIRLRVNVHSIRALSSLPNAFTPNGDGKNDCFGIKHWGTATIEQFMVYNRWGQMVFNTRDVSSCWDGYFNGSPQPAGTYLYVLQANTVCGRLTKKGMVTLVR